MTDPCERCKRTACPEVCWPKKDYKRALRKRHGKDRNEKGEKRVL